MTKKNLQVSQALRYLNEDYKMDIEGAEDISEEYAKLIISKWVDSDGKPLQYIFDEVVQGDELHDHTDVVYSSLTKMVDDLVQQAHNIKVPEVDGEDLSQDQDESEYSPSEMTNG
jgi:hypothetical protein